VTATAATPAVLPGIATAAFLQANNAAVGSVFPAAVGGATVPVKIVAAVSAFPTVTGADGALIVDLAAVQDYLAGKAQQPLAVTSWWLRAAPGAAAAPAVPADAVVTDRAAVTAALNSIRSLHDGDACRSSWNFNSPSTVCNCLESSAFSKN
jgi:hypothetical protein